MKLCLRVVKLIPPSLLEKCTICYSMVYNNKSNLVSSDVSPGNHLYRPPKKSFKLSWKLPPIEWLRWNTDVSKILITNLTSIGLLYRKNKGR